MLSNQKKTIFFVNTDINHVYLLTIKAK